VKCNCGFEADEQHELDDHIEYMLGIGEPQERHHETYN
jgi:hypothetical protein